jgi:hypothetical protein
VASSAGRANALSELSQLFWNGIGSLTACVLENKSLPVSQSGRRDSNPRPLDHPERGSRCTCRSSRVASATYWFGYMRFVHARAGRVVPEWSQDHCAVQGCAAHAEAGSCLPLHLPMPCRRLAVKDVRLIPRSRSLTDRGDKPAASASSSWVNLASARSCRNSPANESPGSATAQHLPPSPPPQRPHRSGTDPALTVRILTRRRHLPVGPRTTAQITRKPWVMAHVEPGRSARMVASTAPSPGRSRRSPRHRA